MCATFVVSIFFYTHIYNLTLGRYFQNKLNEGRSNLIFNFPRHFGEGCIKLPLKYMLGIAFDQTGFTSAFSLQGTIFFGHRAVNHNRGINRDFFNRDFDGTGFERIPNTTWGQHLFDESIREFPRVNNKYNW